MTTPAGAGSAASMAAPPAAASAPASRLARGHHLRAALRLPGFRRLFTVRLAGQFGDGVFQASLAGAVLFSPDHQSRAADIAAGFAILLLPYSILGPFAGVLLDRWWRQRVLVWSNVLRAVAVVGVALEIASGLHGEPFYASALVVLSVSRFFLAALSASLPHVIGRDELVTANAMSVTLGAVATTAGGGAAIGIRTALGSSSNAVYASLALAAVVPYLLSALAARGFGRCSLGPDAVERAQRETAAVVLRGLIAGARHLRARPPAFRALSAIAVHRLCYGLFAVCTLLLFRHYYRSDGPMRVGLAGLAQLVTVLAVGGALAALVTPAISRRIGYVRWSTILLSLAAVTQLTLVLPYRLPLYVTGAMLLGFCAQGIKICVDTTIQRTIADEFRGRVFALYDTLFNLALVVAATITAAVLPDDGRAPASVVVIAVLYVLTAAVYLRASSRAAPLTAAATPTTG